MKKKKMVKRIRKVVDAMEFSLTIAAEIEEKLPDGARLNSNYDRGYRQARNNDINLMRNYFGKLLK